MGLISSNFYSRGVIVYIFVNFHAKMLKQMNTCYAISNFSVNFFIIELLGTLKATSENNLNEHCVLTFNRKSKDTSTAEKSREKKLWNFRTICFETLWNEWSEWSSCNRRTKVQKRRLVLNLKL